MSLNLLSIRGGLVPHITRVGRTQPVAVTATVVDAGKLGGLGVDLSGATDGDVLTYQNGGFVLVPLPADSDAPAGFVNPATANLNMVNYDIQNVGTVTAARIAGVGTIHAANGQQGITFDCPINSVDSISGPVISNVANPMSVYGGITMQASAPLDMNNSNINNVNTLTGVAGEGYSPVSVQGGFNMNNQRISNLGSVAGNAGTDPILFENDIRMDNGNLDANGKNVNNVAILTGVAGEGYSVINVEGGFHLNSGDVDGGGNAFKNALFIPASYTVAGLPSGMPVGSIAYASNALKPTETTGGGTGLHVWYDGTNWLTLHDLTVVAV